jgi:hypothetical protein
MDEIHQNTDKIMAHKNDPSYLTRPEFVLRGYMTAALLILLRPFKKFDKLLVNSDGCLECPDRNKSLNCQLSFLKVIHEWLVNGFELDNHRRVKPFFTEKFIEYIEDQIENYEISLDEELFKMVIEIKKNKSEFIPTENWEKALDDLCSQD